MKILFDGKTGGMSLMRDKVCKEGICEVSLSCMRDITREMCKVQEAERGIQMSEL
jgi:hypothetical protein